MNGQKRCGTYIYSAISLSHKKERNFAICNSMNEFGWYYASEISQIEKGKYYVITYMWNQKIKTN